MFPGIAIQLSLMDDTFFGLVVTVFAQELGTFTLSGLERTRGLLGMSVERDRFFSPRPLSVVKGLHQLPEQERT